MTDASPFPFRWNGDAMEPVTAYWKHKADQRFVVGEKYLMTEQLERSLKSHQHYFANLHEAWQNLPETLTPEYPSAEHLRKRALVMTGYRNETVIVCATSADALRTSTLVGSLDQFAVVIQHREILTVWRAKSQSMREMGAKDFAKSKTDVLAWCWNLVGVDPETGNANAGRAA